MNGVTAPIQANAAVTMSLVNRTAVHMSDKCIMLHNKWLTQSDMKANEVSEGDMSKVSEGDNPTKPYIIDADFYICIRSARMYFAENYMSWLDF